MDIKQIEYMLAIAEEKSFTKAAERLFVSQSALSQQVAKLKKEGLPPLFCNVNGKVVLTDAGKIYVHGAYQIQKIQHDTKALMEQTTRPAAYPYILNIALCLGMKQQFYDQVLLPLHQQYPDLQINFVKENIKNAKAFLANGGLHIAFFYTGETDKMAATQIVLNHEELVIACSAKSAGNQLPLILPPPGTYLRIISDFVMEQHGLKSKGGIETADLSSCIPHVKSGTYAMLLPRDTAIKAGLSARKFEPAADLYLCAEFSKGMHSQFLSDICSIIRDRLF